MVEGALGGKVEREREAGQAVGEDTVVDIAATGKVSGQGRRLLPHLAPTAGVLVVTVRERLTAGEPQPLRQEEQQQPCGDALRQVEAKAAKTGEPVSHHDEQGRFQSKWLNPPWYPNAGKPPRRAASAVMVEDR